MIKSFLKSKFSKQDVIVKLHDIDFHFHQTHYMTMEALEYFLSKLNEEFLYMEYLGKEKLINDFVNFIEELKNCRNPIIKGVAEDFSKQIKREGTYFSVFEVCNDIYFNFENPHKKNSYIYGMKLIKRLDKE